MTKDEIIEMAHQAGFGGYASEAQSMFMEFAALVAEKEREACAIVCEDAAEDGSEMDGYETAYACANAIRARKP